MSADPVTVHEAGSDINPYSYGNGNPTNYVDPDGREAVLVTIAIVALVSAAVAGSANAAHQYSQTGHVHMTGANGVWAAAGTGAVAGLVGFGVGAFAAAGASAVLGNGAWGALGAGAFGGAAGGAAAGVTSSALSGGRGWDVGKAALTGAVSGAIGGGVGVLAGSGSSSASTSFGGSMAGTGAGTAGGIGFGWAAWGEEPTWQSAGLAFGAAFAGTMATRALSAGWSAATEQTTAGRAVADTKCKSIGGKSGAVSDGSRMRYPDVPQIDKSALAGADYAISRLLSLGKHDDAVQSAFAFWGIDGMSKAPTYSKTLPWAGDTNFNSETGIVVKIGPSGATSGKALLSTAYHEGVHVRQAQQGNWSNKSVGPAADVNELEAYNSELALAKTLNLRAYDVREIVGASDALWSGIKGTKYEPRVAAGNYRLMRGDYR